MFSRLRGCSNLDHHILLWLALVCLVLSSLHSDAAAQQQASEPSPEAVVDTTETGIVVIDGQDVLTVYQTIGAYTASDRADHIADRIISIARGKIPAESVRVQPRDAWTEILAEDQLIMAVTDADAKLAGKPRAQLAAEDAGNIRQAILAYRKGHKWSTILRGILFTLLVTLALVPIAWVFRKTRVAIKDRVGRWIETRIHADKKSALQVAATYLGTLLLAMGSFIRWLLVIAIIEGYLAICLSFFSSTRYISHAVSRWLFATLAMLGKAGLNYLPNLLLIAVICVIASQVFRLINMFFSEIEKGSISFNGFYPEWAAPTAKLIRILVLVLVVVVIFPYLPGSKSPAFQGISIFVGVLLSLGSSSAVANAIAGIIITYMRSFLVGDWVKIGDTTGEVFEKNMLVTRILTQKNEVITIPNAAIMAGSVTNFTREAKRTGVIFHTTVTIGYDAPWRKVHELLLKAALATNDILDDPKPFVLQTALNDFYVAYELNAYTDKPLRMQFIYSDLHQNIQDAFNEAGVEICSPHFAALRDGNTIAIPEQYIPREYEPRQFQIDGAAKSKVSAATKGS